MQFSEEHRAEARELQNEMSAFRTQLQDALNEVWPSKSSDVDGDAPITGWAERMEERIRNRKAAVDAIIRPEFQRTEAEWKIEFL